MLAQAAKAFGQTDDITVATVAIWEKTMSKLFEDMAQGTAEARAYAEGERMGYKVTPLVMRALAQPQVSGKTPGRSQSRAARSKSK